MISRSVAVAVVADRYTRDNEADKRPLRCILTDEKIPIYAGRCMVFA